MKMNHIVLCILTLVAVQLGIRYPAYAQPFQYQMDRWVMQDSLNPPPDDAILFAGSSSFLYWETLTRDFSQYDVIQRGFGGSQFSDLNLYVNDIVLPYDPAAIVVFEGSNDTAWGKSPQQVFNDYLNFVNQVHTGQNQTRSPIPVYFLGITPTPSRWYKWPIASAANAMIEAHTVTQDSLYYIDAPSLFLATSPDTGQPPAADMFADGIHLSSKGYAVWTNVITTTLEETSISTKVHQRNPLHPQPGSRILIDFGPVNPEDGDHTTSPDDNENYWNNWHPMTGTKVVEAEKMISAGESLGNLMTIEGQETGIDLIITGGFGSAGKRDGGLLAPDPGLLGELAVASATEDFFWSGTTQYVGGNKVGGFMLTGLDPSLSYDLRFFGTRTSMSSIATDYNIYGAEESAVRLQTSGHNMGSDGQYNGNDDAIGVIERVRSDEFGQIFIDIDGAGNHRTYLGIMEIIVVPEPSSVMLAWLGLFAIVGSHSGRLHRR